ncbi:MAG: heme o synthase [Armatimonadaceae bacterium]
MVQDDAGKKDRQRAMYARFAWGVLLFNLLIIAVGTIVRATGSGDGCGSHWPLCDGEVIPLAPRIEKAIEFSHRVVSGIDGPLVIALVIGAFRLFPKGNPIRGAAVATLIFTLIEALIGALLVKKGWVAKDASAARAVAMSVHLVNTFFLLSCLVMTAWWARGGSRLRFRGQGPVGGGLAFAFLAMIALGVSGAVTALGDTLFPARDHQDAVLQAQYGLHFLQQMRLLHPYIAGSVGLYLLLIAGLVAYLRPTPLTRRYAQWMGYLFLLECAIGFVNVLLRAPVWMQVVHLMVADLVWLALCLLSLSALAVDAPQVEALEPQAIPGTAGSFAFTEANVAPASAEASERPTFGDYVKLTKPTVISLLLLTTLTAMVIAAGGFPNPLLVLIVAVGGYMAAGAANAINMVIDRDIDRTMRRTAKRPTVTRKIPARWALQFAFSLALGSFVLLTFGANLLTAMLALAGLVFYVLVYTLMLKRRTWHNIVIGGAAGAFPPLVGWAAVTGDLKSVLAWYLFGIVFLWTPAHFWALALLMKDEYAEAGVPMLPVVRGERFTVIQIAIYAVLTVIASLAPLTQGLVGTGYAVVAVLLNVALLAFAARLFSGTDRPRALAMFKYSMAYLAILFVAMAVDSAWRG